ncbi:transglycosylase SLT domain-containing protein [Azospirillum sp. RWY-5-1]|uniref:Transglycosylase SLT domain-containing protein n=1 Tax=Azospirillum oleiclasticum TaxID=2735135 RepID=A0ABX2TK54_9PROT|nr:lytic transglycosylase domain-containing protein [Azospirillum oleiclasticum]NYZ16613.1 transglycosylase SLT domain-containing protein [Azospirillum oleiclasticum]NYZ24100.1 transglycosylase SLT domain-containing protein [Azospirillum oleiclasticum]
MPPAARAALLATLLVAAATAPGVAWAAEGRAPGRTAPGKAAAVSPAAPESEVDSVCKAARQGNPGASYRMGRLYMAGQGVPRDPFLAVGWFAAAAEAGHWEARRMMRLLPRLAIHVRPDCGRGARRYPGGDISQSDAAALRSLAARGPVGDLVRTLAPRFGLDPALVMAVVAVESNFDPAAVSPKQAQGLMQLIPETAARFNVRDPFDPVDNIIGGMRYLGWLLSYFRGDVTLALAGYNAGEGAVDRHKGVPPYAETQAYVQRIARLYAQQRHPFDPTVSGPSPAVARTASADRPRTGG